MRFLDALTDELVKRFSRLEKYVVGSGVAPSLAAYFSNVVRLVSLILVLTSIISLIVAAQILQLGLVMGAALFIGLTTAVFSSSILTSLALPVILHANRGYKLEARYPAFLYLFSTLIVSGLGSVKALLELGSFKELEEFKIELEHLINGIHLGKSLDDVIEYIITITPCRSLASLLMHVEGIIRSGRDPLPIINYLIDDYFIAMRSRIEEAVSFIGMMTEAFTAIALIFPLVISVLASTASMIPVGIIDPYLLLIITVLVIVPASSLTYYILVDYITSSVGI